jgi:hypothetical protein
MKKRIEAVQQLLKEKGLYNGAIDGIAGPKTMRALARIDGIDTSLPKTKQVTTFIQISANERDINTGPVDGLWGPQTNAALEELTYLLEHDEPQPAWRPDEIVVANPHNWPVQRTPEFHDFYGEKGSQLTTLNCPIN